MSITLKAIATTLLEGTKMHHKPLLFNILAIGLGLIALSFPLQIAWLYQHNLIEADHLRAIWFKLPINNLMTMVVLLITAWKVWHVKTGIVPWIAASCTMVAINNVMVASYAQDWSQLQTLAASTVFTVGLCTFVFTRAYELSLTPERHWWRPAKRRQITAPVMVEFLGQHRFQAQLFDLSQSGVFITDINKAMPASLAPINEEMAIRIPYHNSFHAFKVKLVRKTGQTGHYPEGWGLCFTQLGLWQRLKLAFMLRTSAAAFQY